MISKSKRRCFMKVKEAITLFQYYQRSNHKERTTASYLHLLKRSESLYGERPFDSVGADEIYHFLETSTEGLAKSTRRLRYAQLKAFYNFVIARCILDMKNPCNTPLLFNAFRMPKPVSRKIPH
jgi:site-specific recombinase XerD